VQSIGSTINLNRMLQLVHPRDLTPLFSHAKRYTNTTQANSQTKRTLLIKLICKIYHLVNFNRHSFYQQLKRSIMPKRLKHPSCRQGQREIDEATKHMRRCSYCPGLYSIYKGGWKIHEAKCKRQPQHSQPEQEDSVLTVRAASIWCLISPIT
jgi:hypothetical protein